MQPTIYLHIGTNKTGTSAIQHCLRDNDELLLAHGVLYPRAGRTGAAHFRLSNALGFMLGKDPGEVAARRLLVEFRKEIAATSPRAIVMSSENLMMPKPLAPVQEFFAGMNLKVVIYLRRHDGWCESAYAQAAKMVARPPFKPGFAAFYAFQRRKSPSYGNYRELVDRWAAAFGKENIIVRPYERQQNEPDIVTDFLRCTSLLPLLDGVTLASKRVNESISNTTLQLLEAFQRADVDDAARKALVAYARALPPADSGSKRVSLVSPTERSGLVRDNLDDYAYIAREYMGRADGKLFLDPLPDPEEAWQKPAPLPPAFIVEQTVNALAIAATTQPPTRDPVS